MSLHKKSPKEERDRKINEIREQYRIDLHDARKKYGDWIPFGFNLDLLKDKQT